MHKRHFILLIASLALTACASLKDAKEAKGTGSKKTFAYSYDKVWSVTNAVVVQKGLKIASSNKASGEILAQKAINLWSYGENVAIFVRNNGANSTEVEVISKRALATSVLSTNWETVVLEGISEKLK